jgi:amino acid permease
LEEFYQEFWWWCFKQLIFDPNSALDWVILIVGTIAAVGAGVLSRDPKATVGVFTLIRSIAGAAKITKFFTYLLSNILILPSNR